MKFKNWVTADVLPQIRKTGGYIPVQPGESDEETIRHAEKILRATLKEKENLLKKQRLQIEQQKKLIGEQDTEIRRLNDVVDEQVVRNAKNGENIIQLENQVGNLLPKACIAITFSIPFLASPRRRLRRNSVSQPRS